MIKVRIVYLWLTLILGLGLSTGCWDRKEMDDLALVIASGIDLADDGQLEGTLQIALPTGIPSAVQAGGSKRDPVLVVSAKGKDGMDILDRIQQQLSRKISFGHRGVIVVGESYARHGLDQVVDMFTRLPESRYNAFIVTGYGATAKEILNTPYKLELIPGIGINKILTSKVSLAYKIDEFLNALSSHGQSPVTGAIRIINKGTDRETFLIDKAAVYRGNRLAGFLPPEELKILRWWKGEATRMKMSTKMEQPDKQFKGTIGVEIFRSRTKIHTFLKNGFPEASFAFKASVRVIENDSRLDISKVQNIHRIETKLSLDMEKEITGMISRAQKELKSDMFGIGREIHIEHPHVWKKIKDQWEDVYPEVPVHVKVDIKIERIGKTQAPAHLKKGS